MSCIFDCIYCVIVLLFGVVTYDIFDNVLGFSYIDELLLLVLGVRYAIHRRWKLSLELIVFAFIFVFYVLYSIWASINCNIAILKDAVSFLKPFLAFYFIYDAPFSFTNKQKQWLCRLCIAVACSLLPIAFVFLCTMDPMFFQSYIHPSRFATIATCTAFLYLYLSSRKNKDWIVAGLIMAIGLASIRAKAIGFFAAFIAVMVAIRFIRDIRITKKHLLGGIIVLSTITLLFAWNKVSFYFIDEVTESCQSARFSLYQGMVDVLRDYPLFGSGFGTYATYSSGEYYSPLYVEYGLKGISGLQPDDYDYVADAFFASLAQFGIIGIGLFYLFWRKRFRKAFVNYQHTRDLDSFCILLLIVAFFTIESIADSTIVQNRGIFMMMILGMVSYDLKRKQSILNSKRIFVTGTRGIPNIMGGVESHCEGLYPKIASMGIDIIIARRLTYVNDEFKDWQGVNLLDIKSPQKKSLEAIIHTWRAIWRAKRDGIRVVHIHAIGPGLLCPLAKILGMKVVFTHHGPDYDRDKWGMIAKVVLKLGERMACVFADEVIVISDVIKGMISNKYGRVNHVHLIYNGVPHAEPCEYEEYFKELGIVKGGFILGMCRFVPEKNLHHLVEAFSQIDNKGCKLVLAGDADFEDSYSKMLKKKAVENGVVLTGFIKGKKLWSLLSNCKAYCLPSSHEGLPISLLEAMSYGARVVVSDIPANKEIGLSNDVYFKCGDINELAEKIQYVVNEDYGKVSYDMSKYDWDNIAQQLFVVYENVMKGE